MWTKNEDTNKWYRKEDKLPKDQYDSLKQEMEKVRLYSVYLSGSTYVSTNDTNNIFDIIDSRTQSNWYIGTDSSPYSVGSTPSNNGKSINISTEDEFYNKFAYEYGLTLKNKFTPTKLINDVIDNYLEVDVATTEMLDNIGTYQPGLSIDGVNLKNGHRVLVKNQLSYITLSSSIDPDTYFLGTYSIIQDNTTSIKYSYLNSDNGIYKYVDFTLVRQDDLSTYVDAYRYSVNVKLGTNALRQFHLNRLRNGYYPLFSNNDPVEFIEKKNYVLRNRVDYNNIYEISYYDIIKHGTQSYYNLIDGYTYSIPQRVIAIGEFGMIAVNQGGYTNIIDNKYKFNLKSICETTQYYWICGDEGTIMRVSKLDFTIKRIDLDEFSNFMSVDFFDDLRGIVVGKFNTIYYTDDGGNTWRSVSQPEFDAFSYNKVIYTSFTKAYIGGDSGAFIQMEYLNNKWVLYKRRIIKYLDTDEPTEEYLMVDDINDMCFAKYDINNQWALIYGSQSTSVDKEVIFLVTNGGHIIAYDVNGFAPGFDFLSFTFQNVIKDINSIVAVENSTKIYIASDKVYSFDVNNFLTYGATCNDLSFGVNIPEIIAEAELDMLGTTWSNAYSMGYRVADEMSNGDYFTIYTDDIYGNTYSLGTYNATYSDTSLSLLLNNISTYVDMNSYGYNSYVSGDSIFVVGPSGSGTSLNNKQAYIDQYGTREIKSYATFSVGLFPDQDYHYPTYLSTISVYVEDPFMGDGYPSGTTYSLDGDDYIMYKICEYINPATTSTLSQVVSGVVQEINGGTSGYTAEVNPIDSESFILYCRYGLGDYINGNAAAIGVQGIRMGIGDTSYDGYEILKGFVDGSFYNYGAPFLISTSDGTYSGGKDAITSYTNKEYDKYVNSLFDFQGQELYMCGNNSLLNYSNYIPVLYDIDSTFGDKYKPKLLFLDYDIASKLNFFDDTQSYRLPNSLTFSSSDIGTYIEITNKDNEYNWLNYYKDVEKTFEYYTALDTSNQILFSSTFRQGPNSYFTFSASDINSDVEAIKSLAPNIDDLTQSRYFSGTTSITGTTYSGKVFVNRYLIIFKKDINYDCQVGDVLYIDSDVISTTLVVNKKVQVLYDEYIYCYTDSINQGIVNDLLAYTGDISVVNLNVFTTLGTQGPKLIDVGDGSGSYFDHGTYSNIVGLGYFAYELEGSGLSGGILLDQFVLHPVSYGYDFTYDSTTGIYTISTKYNNKVAYYNMQTKVVVGSGDYEMNYTDAFLKFGYKPTYNILDYLSNINPTIFTWDKKYYAMPIYEAIPGNGTSNFTPNNIYVTTNYDTNKIMFGSNLKFEWESIWINTFVDVTFWNGTVTSGLPTQNDKLLVMKKYYDSDNDGYVIEFHKKLNTGLTVDFVDIMSRNSLQDISDDLQVLNNIHRLESSLYRNEDTNYTYVNLENELNFKLITDSYCKVLMSDIDTKENLTGIIYIDDKSELSLNIINLERSFNVDILNTDVTQYSTNLVIRCADKHNLNVGDGVVLTFNGGTFSSANLNRGYFGYQVVEGVIDDYTFYTDKDYQLGFVVDPGNVSYLKKDPFLNYQPVDIMEVGVDKKVKRSVEILPNNIVLTESTYSLQNVDYNRFRYEFVDGISLTDIYAKYPWVMESEIRGAVMGQDDNGFVWYKGDWKGGRWFGGTWHSGRWIAGDWYAGTWNSYDVRYRLLNAGVNRSVSVNSASKWFNGRWFDGTWNAGTWYNGRRYDGDWNGGYWYNGIWNDGTWNGGKFIGGIWVSGVWNGGVFNGDSKPSYWIDGKWYGGDFENGMWYNGEFLEKNGSKSRFGTKSFNTRTAIWQGGKFSGGEFHSYLNTDNDGDPIASLYNKYSWWYTGTWNGGDWYGGVAYAINFNGGNWYGGVIEEIQIFGIVTEQDIVNPSLYTTKFILNGLFKFNIGDDIWVVNDNNWTPYESIGTNLNPGKYKVLFIEELSDRTIITVNKDIHTYQYSDPINPALIGLTAFGVTSGTEIETGLRLTTIFRNSTWKQGVWTNGIFESGYFEGGIWYGGIFTANWGR